MNSTDTNNVRDAIIVVEAGNIEAERYYQGAQEPIYPHQPHDTTTAESGTESCSSIKSTKKPTLLLLVVECTSEEMEPNIKNQDDSNQNTLAFILCGPKIRLPLSKRIVVIRSEIAKYSFVLPEGKFITFTFPDETPQIILEEFEEYINQYANFKIKDETMPKRYENTFKTTESSMIEGIEYSGDTISTALINGATIIGSVIKKTGKFIQEHTRSEPEANGKIFPPFRWLVQGTRFASRSSVKVSGSLMKSVIFISSKISQSATENTVCRFLNGSDENPHLKSAKNIGKAGIVAVGNVFDAVEESTDILLNDTTDTIASGMAHRYGDDYGDITREGIGIATDMTRTYRNVRNIGRKSITHSAAKSAAKSSLQTLEQNDNSNKE